MPWKMPGEGHARAVVPNPLRLHMWCLLSGTVVLCAIGLGFWASTGPVELNLIPSHPAQLLVFVGLLLGSTVVFRKPELGLLVLVGLVYSNASEIGVRFHGMPSVLQGLGVMLALVVLGRHLTARERLRCDAILVLCAAYGAVLLGSSLYAASPALADERALEHLRCLLIFALVINLVRSRVTLERAVWALVIAGGLLGAISAVQVLTSTYGWEFGGFGRIKDAQIVGELREARIAGAFADPNFYAQILIPLVPLALSRFLDEASRLWRIVSAFALIACLIALIFTYSRGGILALGVVLGLMLLLHRPKLKHCVAGLALFSASLVFVPPEFAQRLGTLNQFVEEDESPIVSPDSSIQQRSLLMQVAWEEWLEHPFLGVGAGNYSEHYQKYAERIGSAVNSYENFNRQRYAHSLYLETVAETGLIGLVFFMAILVAAGKEGLYAGRVFRRSGAIREARLVASLMIGAIGYLTTSLFLHAHYPRHLWLLLALIAAAAHIAERESSNPLPGGAE